MGVWLHTLNAAAFEMQGIWRTMKATCCAWNTNPFHLGVAHRFSSFQVPFNCCSFKRSKLFLSFLFFRSQRNRDTKLSKPVFASLIAETTEDLSTCSLIDEVCVSAYIEHAASRVDMDNTAGRTEAWLTSVSALIHSAKERKRENIRAKPSSMAASR